MNQRTKEVDTLRRLAELLRQAHAASEEGPARDKKSSAKSTKLRHRDPKIADDPKGAERFRDDAPVKPKP